MTDTLEALKSLPGYDMREVQDHMEMVQHEFGAWILKKDAIAALQAEQGQEPVAHAWFHRGLVNFDAEDSLSLLDNGKTIDLYATPQPTLPAGQWVSVKERLHSDIMKLKPRPGQASGSALALYGLGFIAARHAAAELVAGFDSTDAGGKTA
ncbi:MAG: hypothetical protein ACRYGK_00445 [Janthinobacterium lividum]